MAIANLRISRDRRKPKLSTLQTECAILETMFPEFIEQPILSVIRSISARLERLYQTNIIDLPEEEAKRLAAIAARLEGQIAALEGALMHAKHMHLTYMETTAVTADYWKEKCQRITDKLNENEESHWLWLQAINRIIDKKQGA